MKRSLIREYALQADLLKKLRSVARSEAEMYAAELDVAPPLLVTTVKPEGTLSQLPEVSSGIHYSHSPYFIRRVRINASDPLVKVCEELGYPVFPEVGQEWETCSTKVVEFPVKAPEGKTKYDISAIEQLENYKLFMEHYVDHNASPRRAATRRRQTRDGTLTRSGAIKQRAVGRRLGGATQRTRWRDPPERPQRDYLCARLS